MVEIMYNRTVKLGTFKIESALKIFKEEYSRIITAFAEPIGKDTHYGQIYLKYDFTNHRFYLVTVMRSKEPDRNLDTHSEYQDAGYIGSWMVDKEAIRVFMKQNDLAQKVALGIQNVQISPNDTQITVLTNAQKDAIYNELMQSTFDEIFRIPEDKDSVMLELNKNPKVKEVVNDLLGTRTITIEEAKERLTALGNEPEQLAFMFEILQDYYSIPSNEGMIDSNLNQE